MKERITVTLNKELLSWLDQETQRKIFANRSHGCEFLVQREIEKEMGVKEVF